MLKIKFKVLALSFKLGKVKTAKKLHIDYATLIRRIDRDNWKEQEILMINEVYDEVFNDDNLVSLC